MRKGYRQQRLNFFMGQPDIHLKTPKHKGKLQVLVYIQNYPTEYMQLAAIFTKDGKSIKQVLKKASQQHPKETKTLKTNEEMVREDLQTRTYRQVPDCVEDDGYFLLKFYISCLLTSFCTFLTISNCNIEIFRSQQSSYSERV